MTRKKLLLVATGSTIDHLNKEWNVTRKKSKSWRFSRTEFGVCDLHVSIAKRWRRWNQRNVSCSVFFGQVNSVEQNNTHRIIDTWTSSKARVDGRRQNDRHDSDSLTAEISRSIAFCEFEFEFENWFWLYYFRIKTQNEFQFGCTSLHAGLGVGENANTSTSDRRLLKRAMIDSLSESRLNDDDNDSVEVYNVLCRATECSLGALARRCLIEPS